MNLDGNEFIAADWMKDMKATRRAFTLIELLVATAILTVLASLLVGAIGSARRKADRAKCQSNLRQLGSATMAYCQENDGAMPYAWDRNNPDASQNNFYALLKPVLYSAVFDGYFDFESGVFACPTRLKEPLEGNNPFRVSYAMSAYNTVPAKGLRRLWEVEQPARTLLIADAHYRHNHVAINEISSKQIGFKHNERANILFFDGHVEAREESAVTDLVLGF